MAITFVNVGTAGYGTRAITIGIPQGYQKDDLLLLTLYANGYPGRPQLPDGWTQFPVYNAITSHEPLFCYKIAEGNEQPISMPDCGAYNLGVMVAYRGVNIANPIAKFDDKAHLNDGVLFKTISSTINNSMFVYLLTMYTDSNNKNTTLIKSIKHPALINVTERFDIYKKQNMANAGGIAIFDGIRPIAGSSAGIQVIPEFPFYGHNLTVALNPAI